jgi:glycosyltransferase involved in cell wall biosynthesis
LLIAQICPRYYPHIGGVEAHVRAISERLTRQGFDVEVLTTDPSGKLEACTSLNAVTVRRFKSWAPYDSYFFSWELGKYLARNVKKYDVVHAHSYHAFPALEAARTTNHFYLTPHYHGRGHTFFRNLLHTPYKPIARRVLKKATRIFCVSDYELTLLRENFDLGENKAILVGNGIDPAEFQDVLGVEKSQTKILSVARLEEYKGLQYLVRALTAEGLSEFKLEIVGEGPYKPKLVELARQIKVQDRVRFSSGLPRSDLVRKYAEASVFCLLSKYEASGITVMEALAAQTPCIVANESALAEWVDNVNCFATNLPPNPTELANLISRVAGRRTEGVALPAWDDVVRKIVASYQEETVISR